EDVDLRVRSRDPAARIDTSVITRHRRHAYDRLDEMVDYAETKQCRRAVILRYFGEAAPDRCGACDNCRRPARPAAAVRTAVRRERGAREATHRPRERRSAREPRVPASLPA